MMDRIEAAEYINEVLCYALEHGREPGTWYRFHNHVYGTALLAEKIAQRLGNIDPERAYVLGLLHDVGKIREEIERRFHGLIGFDILKNKDKQAARVCLSHTFFNNVLPEYVDVEAAFFRRREDYDFAADYFSKNPADWYDRLIQLCDCLANCNGLVTLEERRKEYIQRYRRLMPSYVYDEAKKMKHYFDEKLGADAYSVFSEISDNFMLEPGRDFK